MKYHGKILYCNLLLYDTLHVIMLVELTKGWADIEYMGDTKECPGPIVGSSK